MNTQLTEGPHPNEVFVFGSNLAGRHGKGAALYALRHYGAVYGVGQGRTGSAYAVPTKDATLRTLPLRAIAQFVGEFVIYAKDHPEVTFNITRVGCGLAGYTDEDMAPLFIGCPPNCMLPAEWAHIILVGRSGV